MNKTSTSRNASIAVFQTIFSGITLFVLYRYLLIKIGSEQVGVWSLILATASATRISEMGFSASAVKFTAKYIARGEKNKASEIIQTTVITIGALLAIVLSLSFPIILWTTPKLIPNINIQNSFNIILLALISVWIGSLAAVFTSGLEGCQRIDLRAYISVISTVIFFIIIFIIVPNKGLIGLAWAQIGQSFVLLIGSIILLKKQLPSLPLVCFKWKYSLFREMLTYGANFQIISIFAMLFEPTTKALMARFGGLSLTAYYEMANRMVIQFRSILVAANQVVVPKIATLYENDPQAIYKIYDEMYRLIFALSLPLYGGIIAIAPIASEFWIGTYEQSFVVFVVLLSFGFWVNNLVSPAYFVNLGMGCLYWNTLSHIIIGILNASLGFIFGLYFGGVGVVLGYVVALIIGSGLITLAFHKQNQMSVICLLPKESVKLLLACFIGLSTAWIFAKVLISSNYSQLKSIFIILWTLIFMIPFFWSHPVRIIILNRFRRKNT